jgi:ABC-type lipoprotein export system ATPase subunit
MENSSIMIRAEHITKKYKNGVVALDDVSMVFLKGKLISITGASGSGKSTLLQILGLVDRQTSGNTYFNGLDTSLIKENQKAQIRNRDIGFIFQSYLLNPKLRAYENVMLPMFLTKTSIDNMKRRAMLLLDRVGLSSRSNHYPKELSGGEQQRVAIARALANNPMCILADEPTGNLDSDNEKIVFKILRDLADEGKCVIVVSHDEIIKDYSDTIYNLNKGILIEREVE